MVSGVDHLYAEILAAGDRIAELQAEINHLAVGRAKAVLELYVEARRYGVRTQTVARRLKMSTARFHQLVAAARVVAEVDEDE
jgi:hypothetical protein